jgi:hypothetical protein
MVQPINWYFFLVARKVNGEDPQGPDTVSLISPVQQLTVESLPEEGVQPISGILSSQREG